MICPLIYTCNMRAEYKYKYKYNKLQKILL